MKQFPHFTIDLETMGNNPTSAIIAIGAVAFDPDTDETSETFYRSVNLQDSIDNGLTIDASTIDWWLKQDHFARRALFEDRVNLASALHGLNLWVTNTCLRGSCWTHATFDAPILGYAYRSANIKWKISYRNQRDIRTLNELHKTLVGNTGPKKDRKGVHHNALDDAMYQAEYISKMLRDIETYRNGGNKHV